MKNLIRFIASKGGFATLAILTGLMAPVGLAAAAGTIGSLEIINGQVKTADLGKAAVTAAKIKKGAVNSTKIADGTISNADIATGAAIAASKINRSGLDPFYINDNSGEVDNADIAAGAISESKISFDTTKTGTITVSPAAYQAYLNASLDNRGDYVSGLGLDYDYFVAPVNLPQGAVVTNVRYQFYDNSDWDTQIWLYRSSSVDAPSAEEVGIVSSSSTSTAWQILSDNSISLGTIDNNNYIYWIHGFVHGPSGPAVKAGTVTITFDYVSRGF